MGKHMSLDEERTAEEASVPVDSHGELSIVRIPYAAVDSISVASIEQACGDLPPVTALDFRNVRFINSIGLSALLKFVVAARKNGYKLFAINVSRHHQKLFKLVEIARFMPIADEQELLSHV